MVQEQNDRDVRMDKLIELLKSGVPVLEALKRIGETRTAFIIEELEASVGGLNNTKDCELGKQYNGCRD